jgi:EAL and modified HD-GYP domain-containing signal transduction protein
LALVGFTCETARHPLLELVEYVKVDIARLDSTACRGLRQQLHGTPVAMLAEKVETQQDYRRALTDGFTLFEGYYFCHPELLQNTKVPANRLVHFEILQRLQCDPLDLKRLSPLVMRDAALTYRLLRLVNSPISGIRQEVRSIESAIMFIGETAFRRIATLAIFSEFNAEQPPEILHMALVRARFCELAAEHANLDPEEQYLLGMFSLLPAMMQRPMEILAPELPLRDEIRRALLGAATRERCLLAWIEAYERNDRAAWEAIAEANGLHLRRLIQAYLGALLWDAAAGLSPS